GVSPAAAAWQPGPERYGDVSERAVPIPMRDGVILRADVHYPADPATGERAKGPFPILVSETPYGLAAADGGNYFVHRGYIVAVVAVRGTSSSQGYFQLLGNDETKDSVEVIRWASRLP